METLLHQKKETLLLKDKEVIERILDGDKELYEILIRKYNQKLYRVIRSYLKEEAEIEDVMQNAYINAFTKLSQFKQASAFSTWLIRIGINEALARIKEKSKFHFAQETSDDNLSTQILELPDDNQLNPQESMIRKETKLLLEKAIDRLEPKYKLVYILREVEEMSIKEVAEVLNLTVTNVKVRLHRAKEMLKEILYNLPEKNKVFEFGNSRCDRITESVMKNLK